jgi:iron complex transport system ATP-binding protein
MSGAPVPPVLACRAVDVRYGDRWLVRALDLEVSVGERWALVGPNGAGKTSLLLVLAGARRADGGTIVLGGQMLERWSVARLAGLRAFVADHWIDPFATSVLETVVAARYRLRGIDMRGSGLRGAARHDRNAAAVGRACLAAMDCAALAARDVRHLSRGERQRVALAAALAQETALVLLDEPISHQDPRHQFQVLQELDRRRNCTFIGALHDINAAARFATHALLLAGDGGWRAGRSADVLTPENLSPLFGTAITEIEVAAQRVFVSTGDAPV